MRVQFLGQEDPLEKEMATHSNILGEFHGQGAWQAIFHGVAKELEPTKPQQIAVNTPSGECSTSCVSVLLLTSIQVVSGLGFL